MPPGDVASKGRVSAIPFGRGCDTRPSSPEDHLLLVGKPDLSNPETHAALRDAQQLCDLAEGHALSPQATGSFLLLSLGPHATTVRESSRTRPKVLSGWQDSNLRNLSDPNRALSQTELHPVSRASKAGADPALDALGRRPLPAQLGSGKPAAGLEPAPRAYKARLLPLAIPRADHRPSRVTVETLRRDSNPRHRPHERRVLATELRSVTSSSGRKDSNLRPPAPQAGALPGCATSRGCELTADAVRRSRAGRSSWRGRARTCDRRTNNPLLYQLSYTPSVGAPRLDPRGAPEWSRLPSGGS